MVHRVVPVLPADNAKACVLLGRDLEEAAVFVAAAAKAFADA